MANHYVTFGEAGLLDAAASMRTDAQLAVFADAAESAAWDTIRAREQREDDARRPDTAHFFPVAHPND